MIIKKLKKLKGFNNRDLFDIKSFVIVFTIYSLISIWLANASVKKDKTLNSMIEKVEVLKSEYVISKTKIMSQTKYSKLLEKANSFEFYSPDKPITILSLEYEN